MSGASHLEGKEEVMMTSEGGCPNPEAFNFKCAKLLWSREPSQPPVSLEAIQDFKGLREQERKA